MSDEQWAFLRDVAKLIEFAEVRGYKLTAGEAYRTRDQQLLYFHGARVLDGEGGLRIGRGPKRTKTMRSAHLNRMAMDFNVFVDGRLTYDAEAIRPLGEYWKSLSPQNVWGGDWGWDAGHFERTQD